MSIELRFVSALAILALASAHAGRARAQDLPSGVSEARTLAACLHREDTEMQRVMSLIADAERRQRAATAEDVRADAREAIVALLQRAREIVESTRTCLSETRIPIAGPEVIIERGGDESVESLARDHGTVHVVESDARLASHVHVVVGERVDGSGTAPDAQVRRAVRSSASAITACYDAYVDRASRREGEVILVFTAAEGGRVSDASVDHAGGFDAEMQACLARAARSFRVSGQRGSSVYSYRLRFE